MRKYEITRCLIPIPFPRRRQFKERQPGKYCPAKRMLLDIRRGRARILVLDMLIEGAPTLRIRSIGSVWSGTRAAYAREDESIAGVSRLRIRCTDQSR